MRKGCGVWDRRYLAPAFRETVDNAARDMPVPNLPLMHFRVVTDAPKPARATERFRHPRALGPRALLVSPTCPSRSR